MGQKLNVRTVLEGSVRKAVNRLRINVQLINTEDGYHLWSERYDREMEDVFAVQDEIARTVVGKLQVKLLGELDAPLVTRQVDDPVAAFAEAAASETWVVSHLGQFLGGGAYCHGACGAEPHL